MPTKHPKLLVTVTEQQRADLARAAQKRGIPVSEIIRQALISTGAMRPDEDLESYGGLRQVWSRDDDLAIITTAVGGTYHVSISVDDWEHHDLFFDTLEAAQTFLAERSFGRK